MKRKNNYEKILQECKAYILSSSQDFIEFKKKELKDVLKAIITQDKWEKDLKTYNEHTGQQIKLPQKEKMLLNMIESKIPPKTDLMFLPTYEDNGIVFKYFVPTSSYQVHSEKIPFKKDIQNLIKEQILPDIEKEFEKSKDHFLIKYIQTGKKLHRAMTTAMYGFIEHIIRTTRDENMERLAEKTESNKEKINKLRKAGQKCSNPNEEKMSISVYNDECIIKEIVENIEMIENENVKKIIEKIRTNDSEPIKILMKKIESDNKKTEELIQKMRRNDNEIIRWTLITKIKENNITIRKLLKEMNEHHSINWEQLMKEVKSENNKTIKELLKKIIRTNSYRIKIVKMIKGDDKNIADLVEKSKTNNDEIKELIERRKKPIRELIQEMTDIYQQYKNNYNEGTPYRDFIKIFNKDEFSHLISKDDYKIYHHIMVKNFITNIHNYNELRKEEKEIKIQEYEQKKHIFYQMLQPSNLEKILLSKEETYAPLREIQSNQDVYKKSNIQMREILKLIYQNEVEESFFDDIEAILFHPNVIIVYKNNKIHTLPTNHKIKEFFYDKQLKTHTSVTEIQQDKDSQEKQKVYFKKLLFETINESLENTEKDMSRDIYKKYIEDIYKIKIKNTYRDKKIDTQPHEINGENISDFAKKYIEQFLTAFPTIFPKYIPEINITYEKTYKQKNVNLDHKREAIFHIIDKRKKNMDDLERDIFQEENKDYTISLNELEIFSKYPNEYLLVFVERALGKIYTTIIKQDPEFINAINQQEIQQAKKHFQKQNIHKDDKSIVFNLFIRYGVKYLQKNYKDIPFKMKEYLDSIFWEKKQIGE